MALTYLPVEDHIINFICQKYSKLNLNSNDKEWKTLTIFDWDDTLFPTTYIKSNMNLFDDPLNMSRKVKDYFSKLSEYIIILIKNAKNYGNVVIITNAEDGWVEYTCSLMPNLLLFLKTIDVISARAKWETYNPHPEKWKEYAFINKLTIFLKDNNNIILNLICIGDSIHEHNAAKRAAHIINTNSTNIVYTKNIHFVQLPSFEILLLELYYTYLYLAYDIDMFISKHKSSEHEILTKKLS